ncbi:hypothetical protein BGW36DRAFT_424284 [Talaromyces proteolyticus]|uniref:Rhodopsin domain-containing protein n=1 Tax=Talaromyces proteolyticus TaxID=1131652 RepID=A0AAD4Q175_9EURO|nr:uncharacterized protein BGW36DRAFT_424284 [Talaromyces proteolyticus]KAH8701989.1 hypothetical protein BGW36DRAFT_424284 [Talaromyces proteolyticus]
MVVLQETGRLTLRLTIAMIVIAVLSVLIRFFARRKTRTKFKLNDAFIVAGLLSFLGVEISLLAGIYTSGGTLDESQIKDTSDLINLFKYVYALESFVTTAITLIKLSILALYRDLFPIHKFQTYTLVIGALCLIWYIICFLINIFQCHPVKAAWQLDLLMKGEATCLVYGHYIIGYEVSNMLLDIAILALPIRVLHTLHLSRPRKIIIGGLFTLGGFIIIVCIIRTVYLSDATLQNPVALYNGLNWTSVELAVGILCACIPVYGPLLPTQRAAQALSKWSSQKQQGKYFTWVFKPSSKYQQYDGDSNELAGLSHQQIPEESSIRQKRISDHSGV